MMDQLIDGSMTILVQAILSILGLVSTFLIAILASYITKKKEALVSKVGAEQYNHILDIAKSVFYVIEQQFKDYNSGYKAKMFNDYLLKIIPHLNQEELDHFREAVVGEFNTEVKPLIFNPAEECKSGENKLE